jgi:cell fate (sporulation/competence/biofilm development) regulator YlbF (YheA/YmcA/DUF963 family)
MTTTNEQDAILQKTLELCQTILDQGEVQMMRRDIDTFLADDGARTQYRLVVEKSEALQQKQQQAVPLSQKEIEDFEKERQALIDNPVARAFLDAQKGFQQVQQSVLQYVTKTIELGRVPAPEDFASCEPGCSCGH